MTWFGMAIVIGALLALLGASLGFGGGIALGYVVLPVAIVLVGLGTAGRALVEPGMSSVLVVLALLVAGCTVAVALVAVLQGVSGRSFDAPNVVLHATFVVLLVSIVAFGAAGLLSGQLPAVPALAIVAGACLLTGGLLDQERVADVGFWLSVAGWVWLGASAWGTGVSNLAGGS